MQQHFLNLVRGRPGQLPPPVESMKGRWGPAEESMTGADKLILTAHIHDHGARLRSFELAAGAFREISEARGSREGTPGGREQTRSGTRAGPH